MNAPLPINLMLVEDERVIAFDLKNQLQSFGYRVGAVLASGEQAVHRVADVVLLLQASAVSSAKAVADASAIRR